MNLLIIGGAGYIGSHVALECLDAGYEVTVYDNFSSGNRKNCFPEETVITGDILDIEHLQKIMKTGGYDAIVHLAAFKAAGESMEYPEKYSVNNITGTINILNAAAAAAVPAIVFSSSAAVYGEPEYVPIDESHPVNPTNYYGFTKLEIERILEWYGRLKGIRFLALRYFNAAGYDIAGRIRGKEKGSANLIPIIMEVASGERPELSIFGNTYDTPDGTCIRDYIHVNDLAAAHVSAVNYLAGGGESTVLNLGTGQGVSVTEVIDLARKITGQAIKTAIAPRRAGDPARLTASSAKAAEVLGWKALHSDMETLISTSWAIYKKSRPV